MRKNKLLRNLALGLMITNTFSFSVPAYARSTENEILTLGGNLSSGQENQLRQYFNTSKGVDTIYVTAEVAAEQLGYGEDYIKRNQDGWFSSAYIKLAKNGGIDITTEKFTLVSEDMLANALITSSAGKIKNAEIVASCPSGMTVTGESALVGILAGVEKLMGETLDQSNKEVAQEEVETTIDVSKEIGDKEASIIMNEIKSEVIKIEGDVNQTQIGDIVINITNNYGVTLSEETQEKVEKTMARISDLDIKYEDVNESLKDTTNKLINDLKNNSDKGHEIKIDVDKLEKNFKDSLGFFEKIWTNIRTWWNNLCDSVGSVFNSDKEELNDNDTDDANNTDTNTNTNESEDNQVPSENSEGNTTEEKVNEQVDDNKNGESLDGSSSEQSSVKDEQKDNEQTTTDNSENDKKEDSQIENNAN